jgi:hypothetical protein
MNGDLGAKKADRDEDWRRNIHYQSGAHEDDLSTDESSVQKFRVKPSIAIVLTAGK